MQAQFEQNDLDVRMARNAAKPAVDLFAGFFSQGGSGPNVRRGPQEFKAGLAFDFSVQNRTARGKQFAAEAKGRQLETRIGFVRDQIRAEVQDSFLAARAAYERAKVLAEEVQISRELEEAERTRFTLGEGTLFVLNQREQATMDAAVREALAQADYERARAGYQYATGALLYR
jgi:outer membrane protein TolC